MAITIGILPTIVLIMAVGFYFEIEKREDEYAEWKKRGFEDLDFMDDIDFRRDGDEELPVPVYLKDKSSVSLPKRSA